MTELTVTPGDRRRGAVLLAHYAGGDLAGVAAILAEAIQADDDLSGLLVGIVEVVLTVSAPLRTPEGVELLRRVAAGYAHVELSGGNA